MPISPHKLTRLRELKGFTQEEFAYACGVTKDYISKVERGIAKNTGIEIIDRFAKVLDVSTSDLLMDFGEQLAQIGVKNTQQIIGPRMVPVLGKAACGKWEDFTDLDYPAGHADRWEPSPSKDPNAFYLIAKGNSMVGGDIKEGDLLLIEPNAEVHNGNIVLAKDEDKGCMVKKFIKNSDGTVWLMPMNPDFQPVHVTPHERFKVYRVGSHTRVL